MTHHPSPVHIIVWSRAHVTKLLVVIGMLVLPLLTGGPVARPQAYATLGEAIAATVPAGSFTQEAYLKASNTGLSDSLGYSLAIDGDTAVVGSVSEDSNATGVNGNQANNSAAAAGAAYVFVRNAGLWSQQAYLKASNTDAGDEFGASVGISGDTIVVGANREDSNARGVNGALNGGLQSNNSALQAGAAYVFVRNGTTWSQQAYLKASNAATTNNFGVSVAVSGDTIAVGAHAERSSATGIDGSQLDTGAQNAGAVYIFARSGTTWSQQAYVKASTTAGATAGLLYGDVFGRSVALNGDTLVVGSANEFGGGEDSAATGVNGNQADNSALESGAAWVFVRAGSTWSQQAYLKASNTGADDRFGFSVAVSGDRIVVGAYLEDSGPGNPSDNSATDAGAAYVFVRSGTTWAQEAFLKPSNTAAGDRFGWSVSISGDRIVIGSPQKASQTGAAYLFSRSGGGWTEEASLAASNAETVDLFGHAVAISGDTILVAATHEDGGATGVNGDQANNLVGNSGAVYAFVPRVNQPPVANAGADLVVSATSPSGANVTLSAVGSSDPDGDSLTYTWREGAVVVGTGQTVTTLASLGTHTFTVTVEDGQGGQDVDDVSVLVRDVLAVTSVTPPLTPATYTYGAVVPASYSCSSSAGILASCVGTVANGAAIDTATLGTHVFEVVATNTLGESSASSWTYEVVKASSSVAINCPATVVYSGAAYSGCTATASGAGMTPVDVSASLGYVNNVGVGTATVSASWAGDANHHGSTGLGSFTIVTKALTATLTANSKVYDGTTSAPNIGLSCALAGVAPVDAGNVVCSPSAGVFDNPNVGSPRSVTATLTLTGSAAGNYTFGASGTNVPSTVAANAPTSTAASAVYGQAGDFTTGVANSGGVSAASLASARGVAADTAGNIYVADRDNNRVLFFPFGQTTATRVYGQAGSFTTNTVNNGGLSADSLRGPTRVSVDSHGGLYVSDPGNFRVLYFPPGSTTATRVYGQLGSFTTAITNNGGISADSLGSPRAVAIDADDNVYIADATNSRVLFYPAGSTTATRVYGQNGNFTTGLVNNTTGVAGVISAESLNTPNGIRLDTDGNLYVVDQQNNRVLMYPAGQTTATAVYGQGGSFVTNLANNGGISADSLSTPSNLAVDGGNNVYVADQGNARVLFFPSGQTTATVVYGQFGSFANGTPNNGGASADSLSNPNSVDLDFAGNIYVSDFGNNRVLRFTGAAPAITPATLTISAASVTKVYGTAAVITPTFDGFVNGETSAVLTTAPVCTSAGTAPDAPVGTYAITCSGAAADNYSITYQDGTVAVTPATSVTVVSCPATSVYTGAAQELCTVSVTGAGGLSLTLTPAYSNNTNVGTATASYSYAGDANHDASTGSATFQITKATSATEVTCAPATSVYTGAAQELCTVSVTGAGGLSLTPAPTYSNNTNVGTATASYSYAGDANHDASTGSATFEITKATSATAVTCAPATSVYTGAAQELCTVSVTGAGSLSLTPTPAYSNNTNVGTATASYSYAGDANHDASTGSATFEITKATSTTAVTCAPATSVYTGAAQELCTVSVTGAGGLSLTPTPTYTNNTNVGTATASYSYAGDANHDASTGSATFAITKAGSTTAVTCAPATSVYTGAAQELCTVSVTGAGSLSLTPTPTYSNNTNVGTATASYSYAGDANHDASTGSATFEITKAGSTTTVTCAPATSVYTGAAQELCTVSVTGAGGLSLTPTPTYTNNTNVGTATASYSYAGDANHDASTGSATFEITKAGSTTAVTCAPATSVYTGAAQELCTVSVTGAGGLNLTPTPTYTNNTNVGTATASYSYAGDANHDASTGSATFEITKATSTTAVTCAPATSVYTGAAQELCTVSVTGAGGLSLTPAPTYSNNTNVGTATASYSYPGDANHDASTGSATFAITKAGSTTAVTCAPATSVYTGAAQEPCTVSVTGAGGLSLTPTPTYTNNTNVGTASASYSYAGDANHDASTGSATFEITKATSTTAVTCAPATSVYTGAAQELCTVSVTGAGSLSLTATPTYSNNTNVGTATASYSYAGDANHDASTGSATFAITKATIAVTANNATRAALAPNPVFGGSLTGVLGTDGITATYSAPAATLPGTYPITPTLVDPNGRLGNYEVSSTNGTLTVVDLDPPVVTVPTTPVIAEATGVTGAVVDFAANVSAFDAVFGPVTVTCSPASGTTFAIGTTSVQCSAADAVGNIGTASFDVTVRDTTAPTLTAPDITVVATDPAGRAVTFTPMGQDVVDGPVASTCSPTSETVFAIGSHVVTCSATDAAGNVSESASFTVHVLDGVLPVVTVPTAVTIEATAATGATVTFAATAADNVDEALTPTCLPASGTVFALGETSVTCTATDAAGNIGSASFTVTVRDTVAPTLQLPTVAPVVSLTPTTPVTYVVSASDIVDGAVAVSCAPASGTAFPVGNTTVSCSTADAHGNAANGSFVVTVTDGVAPVVTVTPSGDRIVEATSAAGAVVTFAATATDNRDSGLTATCSPASGSTFPLGAPTLVTCAATDLDGNVGSTTFTVTVVDTTAPGLTLPAPISMSTTGTGGVAVTFAATAADVVDGSVAVTCAPASGATFAIGTTTVTCAASDTRGNTTSGSFTVTVTREANAIGRFVVFSQDNTRLRSNVTVVSGDIGANDADRDRRHGHRREDDDDRDDITVQLGERVKMQQAGSRVVGDTVKLQSRASVYDVVTNNLINRSGTVLGTIETQMQVPYLTMPVFPTVTPGTSAVTVKKKTSRVLAPGSYGAVKVESGATLILTGGQYRLLSLDVAESGVVLLRGASEVLIKRELDTDSKAKIVLDQNVPGLKASQMVFYVEGRDTDCQHERRNDDGDDHGPAVVRIGQQNVVQANIYAKNGTVWLMSKTTATGAFIGEHVRIGQKVTLTLDSTFR